MKDARIDVAVKTKDWEQAARHFAKHPNDFVWKSKNKTSNRTFLNFNGNIYNLPKNSLLGKGKSGTVEVFKVQNEHGDTYALKKYPKQPNYKANKKKENDVDLHAKYGVEKQEIEVLEYLKEFYGAAEHKDNYYILMQFKPGQELFNELMTERKREADLASSYSAEFRDIPYNVRLAIAIKTAEAVAKCHDHSVIHNDIKPQNFMLDISKIGENIRLDDKTQEHMIIENLDEIVVNTIDYEFALIGQEGFCESNIRRDHPRDKDGNYIFLSKSEDERFNFQDLYLAPEIDPLGFDEPNTVWYSFNSDVYALMNMLLYDFDLSGPEFKEFLQTTIYVDENIPFDNNPESRPSAENIAEVLRCYLKLRLESASADEIQVELREYYSSINSKDGVTVSPVEPPTVDDSSDIFDSNASSDFFDSNVSSSLGSVDSGDESDKSYDSDDSKASKSGSLRKQVLLSEQGKRSGESLPEAHKEDKPKEGNNLSNKEEKSTPKPK